MSTPTISRLDLPNMTVIKDATLNKTVEQDVMAGPCRLFGFIATGNATEEIFLKFYDNQEPTAGTTAPDFQFPIPDASPVEVVFPEPIIFENGLSLLASTEKGTPVTTDPTGATNTCILTLKGGVS